jgi:hypothetical protein
VPSLSWRSVAAFDGGEKRLHYVAIAPSMQHALAVRRREVCAREFSHRLRHSFYGVSIRCMSSTRRLNNALRRQVTRIVYLQAIANVCPSSGLGHLAASVETSLRVQKIIDHMLKTAADTVKARNVLDPPPIPPRLDQGRAHQTC